MVGLSLLFSRNCRNSLFDCSMSLPLDSSRSFWAWICAAEVVLDRTQKLWKPANLQRKGRKLRLTWRKAARASLSTSMQEREVSGREACPLNSSRGRFCTGAHCKRTILLTYARSSRTETVATAGASRIFNRVSTSSAEASGVVGL